MFSVCLPDIVHATVFIKCCMTVLFHMKALIFTIQTINMKLAAMLTTYSGGIYIMGTTQPIKNKKDITALKEYFLTEDFNLRNYTLITMGINTALRISDILERCIQRRRAVFPESFKQTGTENRKKHLHCFESERDTGSDTLSEQHFRFIGTCFYFLWKDT